MEVVNRFENYMLNTAAEARMLADMVNHPNINILLDIFHGMIEEDDLAEAIRTAGGNCRTVWVTVDYSWGEGNPGVDYCL